MLNLLRRILFYILNTYIIFQESSASLKIHQEYRSNRKQENKEVISGLEEEDAKENDDQLSILDASKIYPDKLSRLRQQIKSRQGSRKKHN